MDSRVVTNIGFDEKSLFASVCEYSPIFANRRIIILEPNIGDYSELLSKIIPTRICANIRNSYQKNFQTEYSRMFANSDFSPLLGITRIFGLWW